MATQSDRHARLLRLIVLGDGQSTLQTLAAELAVSQRTIRRDIAAMQQLGIAIEEQRSSDGYKRYRLSRDQVGQIKFLYDEAFALMLCRSATAAFRGTSIGVAADNAFEKIRVVLGPGEVDYLDDMLPNFHSSQIHIGGQYEDKSDIIDSLTIGIEENRTTFVTYHPLRSTEPVTYDINPYGIVDHRGTLYVVGFSCHRNEIRTWKVDRIHNADVTQVHFSRPSQFDLKRHFEGAFAVVTGTTAERVRVKFTGSAVRYVQEKRMHPSQQVERVSESIAIATFELTNLMEIKSWILSFGGSAEILEPQSLRQEVETELSRAIELYTRDATVSSERSSNDQDSNIPSRDRK